MELFFFVLELVLYERVWSPRNIDGIHLQFILLYFAYIEISNAFIIKTQKYCFVICQGHFWIFFIYNIDPLEKRILLLEDNDPHLGKCKFDYI